MDWAPPASAALSVAAGDPLSGGTLCRHTEDNSLQIQAAIILQKLKHPGKAEEIINKKRWE